MASSALDAPFQRHVMENFDNYQEDGEESADRAEAKRLTRELFEAAGLEPPVFEDESGAPAITPELRRDLLALDREELQGEEERRVLSLVARFRSVAREFAEISAAEYRSSQR